MTTINYAHRGASGYRPENTMMSFEYAIELGATGIETDVQMTSDGVLVLIHDESLLRTTGVNKLVKDSTWDDIKALDAGSWFDPQFSEATIPSLDELLELVRTHGIMLNIEIKNGLVMYPGIEQKVIAKVLAYGLQEKVIISNFNHYSIADCYNINAQIATGILYSEGLYEPWNYAKTVHASALHAPRYAAFPQWVQEAKQHGIIYNVYTVNQQEEMKGLIAAGVAGIITDYPDRLHQLLKGEN